jgi:universal stress protein E
MNRFRSILALLTEDSLEDVAFERAVGLARATGAALTLVDVVTPVSGEVSDDLARIPTTNSAGATAEAAENVLGYHRARIAGFAVRARDAGVEVSEAVLQGNPVFEVIRMVLREGHDLVVKGAAVARDGNDTLNGFDMQILRQCPCPVWMLMRPGGSVERILAAVDPEATHEGDRNGVDRLVIDVATDLAESDGAEVHVAHAFFPEEARASRQRRNSGRRAVAVDAMPARQRDLADARLGRLLAEYPQLPQTHRHLLEGDPGDAIVEFADTNDCDLIVMAMVRRTGIPGGIAGTTAEAILGKVRCSVVAVKPEGFRSPVTLNGAPGASRND